MIVLGIETTCDETSCSLVRDGHEILSNVIASQIELHRPFGGVFPELACRKHLDMIISVLNDAMASAGVTKEGIDLVAVAKGPGLIGALLIGLHAAKALSLAWQVPFVGVNHVEAHLYAAMMGPVKPLFPALGVVISGGHTFMVKMLKTGTYELIGTTQDDAIGEAFDKVASMLSLPYPGGPAIETLAKKGNPKSFPFRAGKVKGQPWDFSFSGLKTNVLYTLKGPNAGRNAPLQIREEQKADIAASFQEAALSDIVDKALLAAATFDCKSLIFGGGVSNNQRLKALFTEKKTAFPLFFPPAGLTIDNAAMIAGLGFHVYHQQGHGDPLDLEPMTRIPLGV